MKLILKKIRGQRLKPGLSEDIDLDRIDSHFIKIIKMGNLLAVKKHLTDRSFDINHQYENGYTALMAASLWGHLDTVRLLCDGGAKVDIQDKDGHTALMFASLRGHLDTVRLLCDGGAKVDIQDKGGHTALMCASHGGHQDTVRLLCDCGAKLDMQDEDGWTALMFASGKGQLETVRLLYDYGAKFDMQDEDGWTALMLASQGGHIDTVRLLCDGGAKVDMQEKDGVTALMLASHEGQQDTVRLLCDGGAKVDIQDKDGGTALMLASQEGQQDTVRLLCDYGAKLDMQNEDGVTALMLASQEGQQDTVRLLCDGGAKVDIQDKDGVTALMFASQEGHINTVRLLCDGGAKVDMQKKDGSTSLMFASFRGHLDTVRLLCDGGAKVDKEKDGGTALMLASQEGQQDTVRLLCDGGANVDMRNKEGNTALMYASSGGHIDTVRLLCDCGAKVDMQDKEGHTALMYASSGGHIDTVRLLCDCGAKVDMQDKHDRTALSIALDVDHQEIVQLLTDIHEKKSVVMEKEQQHHTKVKQDFKVQSEPLLPNEKVVSRKNSATVIHDDATIIEVPNTGAALHIPKGAVPPSKEVQITVSVYWGLEYKSQDEDEFAIGPAVFCEPTGMIFDRPVILSIPHSAEDLSLTNLKIFSISSKLEAINGGYWKMLHNGEKAASEGQHQHIHIVKQKPGQTGVVKLRINHFSGWRLTIFRKQKIEMNVLSFMHPYDIQNSHEVSLNLYCIREDAVKVVEEEECRVNFLKCSARRPVTISRKGKNDMEFQINLDSPVNWKTEKRVHVIQFNHLRRGNLKSTCTSIFRKVDSNKSFNINTLSGRIHVCQAGQSLTSDDIRFSSTMMKPEGIPYPHPTSGLDIVQVSPALSRLQISESQNFGVNPASYKQDIRSHLPVHDRRLEMVKTILTRSTDIICKNLDPKPLLGIMQSAEALTPDDARRIDSKVLKSDQSAELLYILMHKPVKSYAVFMDALKINRKDIYEIIEGIEREVDYTRTRADSTLTTAGEAQQPISNEFLHVVCDTIGHRIKQDRMVNMVRKIEREGIINDSDASKVNSYLLPRDSIERLMQILQAKHGSIEAYQIVKKYLCEVDPDLFVDIDNLGK